MSHNSEFRVFGRRLHVALRTAIENPDVDPSKWAHEKPYFEHHICVIFLAGVVAYLEGKYKNKSRPKEEIWSKSDYRSGNLNDFLKTVPPHEAEIYKKVGVCCGGMEALVCIRNAVIHNAGDLAQNRDRLSLDKVTAAALPGVTIRKNIVTLRSIETDDFLNCVRLHFLAMTFFREPRPVKVQPPQFK